MKKMQVALIWPVRNILNIDASSRSGSMLPHSCAEEYGQGGGGECGKLRN